MHIQEAILRKYKGTYYTEIIQSCNTAIDVESTRDEETSFEKIFEIFPIKLYVCRTSAHSERGIGIETMIKTDLNKAQ
jgi:hypothetical protein